MNLAIFKIYPRSGQAPGVIDVLESMKVALASIADCQGCTVAFEADEDETVIYTERWRSREALESHLRSPIFLRVLEAMEFSRKAPKMEFFTVSEVGGLEVIEMARLKDHGFGEF